MQLTEDTFQSLVQRYSNTFGALALTTERVQGGNNHVIKILEFGRKDKTWRDR